MKRSRKIIEFTLLVLLLTLTVTNAQETETSDQTLSPYFFIKSDDPETDRLPLKSTQVKVNIAGVIADVRVSQVYKNEGQKPLEAIYVFPASTRAAVYGMKMSIGERTIIAKVREREQARREYEKARQAGQSVSLLEQQRPNVFQMNVANILPGDIIKVELQYTELLVPTSGAYEFVYPTVVGPRYSNQPSVTAPASEKWIENPYLHQNVPPTYEFGITASISSGLSIHEVLCPSHKVNVSYDGPALASIKLDPLEKHGGNRDFIMQYRLAGGKIESGLLLYEGKEENFFLLMIQPPRRVSAKQIPAREYIFVVDVSGSMHGFPLDISKKLLKDLIGNLRPIDTFNVLLFAGGSSLLAEKSVPATPENIREAIDMIERQRGGGGTELLPALQRALAIPFSENYARTVIIATDGYVSVEKEVFDLIRNNLGDANVFPFGIGSSVNRHIIEGMARAGMGEPFIVSNAHEAPAKEIEFRKLIESPVLTQIKADFGEFEVYDVEPPAIPDVLAERPVIIFGKWRGRTNGTITVQGVSGEGAFKRQVNVDQVTPSNSNAALKYLWARHRIAILGDYNRLRSNDKLTNEITRLGLAYNLLTANTSFVAIDSQKRLKNGKAATIKQPLPLPQGVSDYAVCGHMQNFKTAFAPKALYDFSVAEKIYKEYGGMGRSSTCQSKSTKSEHEFEDTKTIKPLLGMRIKLDKLSVKGALATKAVEKVFRKNLSLIENCFKQALSKQKNKSGSVAVKLEINAVGRVVKVTVITTNPPEKEFAECIVKKIKRLRFPATENGNSATVTVSFIAE